MPNPTAVSEDTIVAALKENLPGGLQAVADRFHIGWGRVNRIRERHKLPKPSSEMVKEPTLKTRLDASDGTAKALSDAAEMTRLKNEIKKLHRERLNDDAMAEILRVSGDVEIPSPHWLINVPKRGPGGTPEVPVLSFADWHLGEVVSLAETGGVNEYNISIARDRVREVVTAALHLCRNHGPGLYPGMVVNLLGDFVSGGIHPELLKTDELEILPSIYEAVALIAEALRILADEFGFLYVPCVCGNHGRLTMKPEFKRYVYKNADWLIYKLLRREFAGDKRIVFSIPPSNDAHYRIFGKRILAVHGDQLGVKGGDSIIGSIGPIMRGEIKTRNQSASMGKDYDLVFMGHWHQELKLPRAIVSNCLIGFNEYAMKVLRAPPTSPSQPLIYFHPWRGITSYWNITTGQKKPAGPYEQWITFPAEA